MLLYVIVQFTAIAQLVDVRARAKHYDQLEEAQTGGSERLTDIRLHDFLYKVQSLIVRDRTVEDYELFNSPVFWRTTKKRTSALDVGTCSVAKSGCR